MTLRDSLAKQNKKASGRGRGRRVMTALTCLLLLTVLFAGCASPGRAVRTTLTADETGRLTQTILEPAGGKDYTAEDVKAYAEESIAAYGGEEGTVSLASCQMQGSDIRIVLTYASCRDYAAFNGMACFLGTIAEAEAEGFTFDRAFKAQDGTAADPNTLSERRNEWKVLILEEDVDVKVPDKILYATENVTVTGRLTATVNTVHDADTDRSLISEFAEMPDLQAYIIYK